MSEILTKYSKQLQSVAAILVIGSFLWGGYQYFFNSTKVEIEVKINDAHLPASISSKFAANVNMLLNSISSDYLRDSLNSEINNLNEVSQFFSKTSKMATYEITNTSSYTLNNVDIRIRNVSDLTAWGTTGNALLTIETTEIMRSMKIDRQSGIISFGSIDKLPPKSTLIITVWGDVRDYYLSQPITVAYDGGSGKVIKTTSVTGFSAFIYDNTIFFIILLLLINIGSFLAIIEKVCENGNEEPDV